MTRARLLVTALALATSACFSLRPQADASRFWHLRSLSQPVSPVAGPSIALEPVRLPAYLDRSHIVERVSEVEVRPLPRDYWAAPLDELVATVLAQEMRAATGLQIVEPFPWRGPNRPDRRIRIEILRLEAGAGTGEIELRARWSILPAGTGDALAAGELSTTEAGGPAVAERVDAMNRILRILAQEVSATLRS